MADQLERNGIKVDHICSHMSRRITSRESCDMYPTKVYGKEFYPIYCEGACYSFHRDTAETLYEVAKRTKRDVPVDDAYITGVLREKAKIPPTQTKNKNLCSHLVNDDQIISKLKTAWENSQK